MSHTDSQTSRRQSCQKYSNTKNNKYFAVCKKKFINLQQQF